MSRFAASSERKPSEAPSDAYNGICSRLEDTLSVGNGGKEFIESPVSQARPQATPPEYQERISVVNREFEKCSQLRIADKMAMLGTIINADIVRTAAFARAYSDKVHWIGNSKGDIERGVVANAIAEQVASDL